MSVELFKGICFLVFNGKLMFTVCKEGRNSPDRGYCEESCLLNAKCKRKKYQERRKERERDICTCVWS